MKKLLFVLFLGFQHTYSQTDDYNELYENVVAIDFLGHSQSLISFNYERILNPVHKFVVVSARVGVGFTPGYENDGGSKYNYQTTLPIVVTTLIGRRIHFAQCGVAYTPLFTRGLTDAHNNKTYERYNGLYSISLGYRYIFHDKIYLQAYPVFTFPDSGSDKDVLSFGLSAGYAF